MLSVQGKTNFFEKRVGDYQKAGVISIRAANTFLLDEAFLTIGDARLAGPARTST
jgi:ribonucleoside-diphosphate reductase beta chain